MCHAVGNKSCNDKNISTMQIKKKYYYFLSTTPVQRTMCHAVPSIPFKYYHGERYF